MSKLLSSLRGLLSSTIGAGGASARAWCIIGIPVARCEGFADNTTKSLEHCLEEMLALRNELEKDVIPVVGRERADAIISFLESELGTKPVKIECEEHCEL